MKRFLSYLFLIIACTWAIPACYDAQANTDYVAGAAARRSRGVSFEDPLAHYWTFINTDDEYLTQTSPGVAFESQWFTIVAAISYDTDMNMDVFSYYDNDTTQKTWALRYLSGSATAGYTGRSAACNNISSAETNDDLGWTSGNVAIIALTFDYSGDEFIGNSDRGVYVVRGGVLIDENHELDIPGPIPDCTGNLSIGRLSGYEQFSFDGDIYWVAYYPSVLTTANMIDLDDGTLHPATNFSPVMYWDGSKAVAATYAPEVGAEYVFNIVGTPTQGP